MNRIRLVLCAALIALVLAAGGSRLPVVLGGDFQTGRKGNLCGYPTDEAWERILPAAAKLRATLSSWKEVGENVIWWRLQEAPGAATPGTSI